jgi:AcrR family transcriptional regulator
MMSRARRQPLSPDRLAQAALALIDEHGLEALSTRRLGKTLGVEGMALYKHFKSRDALLDAVAGLLLCELTIPPKGPSWVERVRSFARGYRALSRLHPRAYVLLATRRLTSERALAVVNDLFAALVEEGFAPAEAALLFRTVANFCHGTSLDELAILSHLAANPRPRDLPMAKVDGYLHPAHFDAHFEAGLSLILDGFARRRAQRKKEKV